MNAALRWERCISHKGRACGEFVRDYFRGDRRVLLVAGAGFDPRALVIPDLLRTQLGESVEAVFIREDRDGDGHELHKRAEENEKRLKALVRSCAVEHIRVFSSDTAVIGGREAVKVAARYWKADFTDVIIDFSALSNGVSFPLSKYFLERSEQLGGAQNVHVMVVANAQIDRCVTATFADTAIPMHGFKGGLELHENSAAALLWMPQLATDQKPSLRGIHERIRPHDTCPILPFPASGPRAGDELLKDFSQELLRTWNVEPGNVIFAAEDDPVDMYRTILKTDQLRQLVFRNVGGACSIISPVGSKVLSIGALMAALDRDIPLYYVEAVSYRLELMEDAGREEGPNLVHVWLAGDVYAQTEGFG